MLPAFSSRSLRVAAAMMAKGTQGVGLSTSKKNNNVSILSRSFFHRPYTFSVRPTLTQKNNVQAKAVLMPFERSPKEKT